ncbi:MAG: response regulator [Kangiellaceae bacterium]|nr:response regulator [Kangiellaceae bacterium]MCW8998157.1 response regulator [Kangiellaceae bacterium]MCW9015639.1 response regulator [Kangiellaceae bacterium]
MPKILIADDSTSMRQMVNFTLKTAGHEVVEAKDGEEALDIASNNQFDLIISDINMPRMNGIELTSKLRTSSNYRFTPILLLTTESSTDKKGEGKAAGATGWIVKPFKPDALIQTIDKVMR